MSKLASHLHTHFRALQRPTTPPNVVGSQLKRHILTPIYVGRQMFHSQQHLASSGHDCHLKGVPLSSHVTVQTRSRILFTARMLDGENRDRKDYIITRRLDIFEGWHGEKQLGKRGLLLYSISFVAIFLRIMFTELNHWEKEVYIVYNI